MTEIALKPTPLAPPVDLTASILVVSYNSRSYLADCLTSLLENSPAECEIILVDNASSDGSADFVATNFPQVRLVRNERNLGFAEANNQAAKLAKGEYIVGLNPDTQVTPGWLPPLLAPLAAVKVGATTPRILMTARPDQINTCGNTTHYTGLTVCRGLGEPAVAPLWQESGAIPAISGACFAVRRAVWEEVGGFDPEFFTYLEDTDFSLRLALAGYERRYVAESVIYHDYGSRFAPAKLYYLERNRWLMLLKNYGWTTLALMLPALMLTELVTWAYTLKSGPAAMLTHLRAYGWLLGHMRLIRQKRRTAQQLRCVSDRELLEQLDWRLDIRQLAGKRAGKLADASLNPLYRLFYGLIKKLAA